VSVGGNWSDFGCPQGRTASRITFFTCWKSENRVLIFLILSFPLGILIYNQFDLDAIKLMVATLIILNSLQNGWHLFHKVRKNTNLIDRPQRRGAILGVGVASGLMASALVMPGPAVMIYLSRTALGKNEIRATILTFFIFSYAGALVSQAVLIGIESQTWFTAAVLTPSAPIGHLLSNKNQPTTV